MVNPFTRFVRLVLSESSPDNEYADAASKAHEEPSDQEVPMKQREKVFPFLSSHITQTNKGARPHERSHVCESGKY